MTMQPRQAASRRSQRPSRSAPNSDVLATVRRGTLLRTGFPYPAWEDRIERALAAHQVRSIKPYDFL